jgi:hypothetical protein
MCIRLSTLLAVTCEAFARDSLNTVLLLVNIPEKPQEEDFPPLDDDTAPDALVDWRSSGTSAGTEHVHVEYLGPSTVPAQRRQLSRIALGRRSGSSSPSSVARGPTDDVALDWKIEDKMPRCGVLLDPLDVVTPAPEGVLGSSAPPCMDDAVLLISDMAPVSIEMECVAAALAALAAILEAASTALPPLVTPCAAATLPVSLPDRPDRVDPPPSAPSDCAGYRKSPPFPSAAAAAACVVLLLLRYRYCGSTSVCC